MVLKTWADLRKRNKFYRLQILVSEAGEFRVWSRWGRVDRNGRSALQYPSSEADALKMFEKKFREKSGLSWVNRHATPKKGKVGRSKQVHRQVDYEAVWIEYRFL